MHEAAHGTSPATAAGIDSRAFPPAVVMVGGCDPLRERRSSPTLPPQPVTSSGLSTPPPQASPGSPTPATPASPSPSSPATTMVCCVGNGTVDLISKLDSTEKAWKEMSVRLGDPDIVSDPSEYQKLAQSVADLGEIYTRGNSRTERKIPSTANAQHGDENTETNTGKITILRTDDQSQMESGNFMQRRLTKVSLGKRGAQNVSALEQKLPKKRKKQKQEPMHEKLAIIDDIPMDSGKLLVRSQDERPLITETGSSDIRHTQLITETDPSDIRHTQSKISEDEDCTIIAAEDGPNYASTVFDTTSQQESSASESNQKALQDHVASITKATSHPLKLQIHGHLQSSQQQQTHLCMGEVVTIAASSPLLSQHKDQSIAEAPAGCWSHKGAKKLIWDSFKTAPRDLSAATCSAQFRSSVQAVDLTSTHVVGASNNYPTPQPVISAVDHYTNRAVNQVQARSFPSTMSTMEAGNLCDRINTGQSGFYPRETMPVTHLLRLTESSTLAGFPNYEGSTRNQMEFQLRNSHCAHNQYRGSVSTSYGSNLNGKVPLTLEDLSRHQLQQNLHKPLRPHPRVGVLSSLLQKEIANWSDSCGTQSGYKIGASKGITSFDTNRRENVEALNSGTFSARWNALQLGSVSSSPDYFSARNSTAQSWIRGQRKMINPLDRLVRQDICVTNRNPSDFTTISDDNEYIREDI